MKIIHVIEALGAGGVTTVAIQIAEHQARSGHDVRMIELKEGDWRSRAIAAGIPVSTGMASLLENVLRESPDVVHCHQRRCGLLSVALGQRKRTVEHVHNIFEDQRMLSFRGRSVVAVSQSVAQNLEEKYPQTRTKLHVIRNAISRLDPADVPSERDRQIIGCGRLEEQKDPFLFLRIADAARELGEGRRWLWVGDGSLRESWLAERKRLGLETYVQWTPHLEYPTLLAQVAAAELTIITSRWEGLPMIALESLSLGTPVLSTDVGELNTLLREAALGDSLPRDNVANAARRVVALAGDEIPAASRKAKRFAEESLSLAAALEQWDALYHKLANS